MALAASWLSLALSRFLGHSHRGCRAVFIACTLSEELVYDLCFIKTGNEYVQLETHPAAAQIYLPCPVKHHT